jgi:acyl dehydratase
MADFKAGDALPEMRVTPDKYLTNRYAGASGDFNPIHIDPDFAKSVGLPSNILHGLYSMGLVSKAAAQGLGGGDPRAMKKLTVQFRGMGLPEQEIVISGEIKEVEGNRVTVALEAAQGDNRIIRNARAELEL